MADEAEECLDGTEEWMGCCAVPCLFTTNGVLLVSEGEVCGGDRVHVIQRDRGGVAELAINAEFDVAQAEGFGSCAAALVVVPS